MVTSRLQKMRVILVRIRLEVRLDDRFCPSEVPRRTRRPDVDVFTRVGGHPWQAAKRECTSTWQLRAGYNSGFFKLTVTFASSYVEFILVY